MSRAAPAAAGAPFVPQASSCAVPSGTCGASPPVVAATSVADSGTLHAASQGQHNSGKIAVEPAAVRSYLKCSMKPAHPGASYSL